jgi:hypothetical protein
MTTLIVWYFGWISFFMAETFSCAAPGAGCPQAGLQVRAASIQEAFRCRKCVTRPLL